MLLVTFHGGSGGINNVYAYSTKDGTLKTQQALVNVPGGVLDELRALAVYSGNLYVICGSGSSAAVAARSDLSHSTSDKSGPRGSVLVFGPPQKGAQFNYLGTVIGASQSIFHPFGVAFDPCSSNCYVSNQDSNVVAQVKLNFNAGNVSGTLSAGCQSAYLAGLYPQPQYAFLDGTLVASQFGALSGITLPNIPDVSKGNGGLGVLCKNGKTCKPGDKPQNSVRDLAIFNNVLYVCDEVDSAINMYSLVPAPPSIVTGGLLASVSLSGSPTHLSLQQNGIWVSAGENLYWSPYPSTSSSLSFTSVLPALPKTKIGGISFDDWGNVYVIFQEGTGGTGSGSIWKYAVSPGSPPKLSAGNTFATIPPSVDPHDTPEFCLWVSDGN